MVSLTTRPVLFALARLLGEAWPRDVARDTLIARETNLPIHVDEDPLTCVVRGAGRILDDVVKYRGVLTN